MPAFAAQGQLEDITDWARSLPYFDQLAPSHVALGTFEDRIYDVPFWIETSVLIRNKDLFEQAGLDPEAAPQSWDEIRDHARRIRALGEDTYGFYFSGNCGGCAAFTFLPLIWGGGGDVLSPDGREVTLDNPDTRAAIEAYRGLVADGVVPDSAATDTGANFVVIPNGNIGMQMVGAGSLPGIVRDNPDFNFGVGLIPGATGGFASFAGGDNFVVTEGTTKTEAILDFLEWVHSTEGQIAMANYGSLPARADTASEVLAKLEVVGALPRPVAARMRRVGLRPEHVAPGEEGDGRITAQVEVKEYLGSTAYLHCRTSDGQALVAEQRGGAEHEPGDAVRLAFSSRHLHLFDEAGLRLDR